MTRIEYELKYLREGLDQLKPFLLSDEIFWNLGLGKVKDFAPYQQLTLGNLLRSAKILDCIGEDEAEEELTKFSKASEEWTSAWQKKAVKEYGYRLRQWGRVLEEWSQSSGKGSELGVGIRNRVLLHLLREEGGEEAQALGSVAALDSRLKRLTEPGEFIWDAEMASCFDGDEYWYLYRQMKH